MQDDIPGQPRPAGKKATRKAVKKAPRKTAKKAAKKAAKRASVKKAARKAPKKTAKKARRPSSARPPRPDSAPRPWLAAYPPGVAGNYEYPLVPLTRLLDDAAKDFPHSVAVEFLGRELTYRELLDQVDRFATALRHLGVAKGDRVGIILPNCPQHVVAVFAALRLGAVVVACDPLGAEAELEAQLNDAGCRIVVCLEPVYPKLAALKGRLATVEHIIATSLADALPVSRALLFPVRYRSDPSMHYRIPDDERVLRLTELVNRTAPAVAQADLDPRTDLAVLAYGAGTGGGARGVMLTHFNLLANAFQGRLWLPDVQAGRENVLCVVPFFHPYGLTACLLIGVLSAATLTLLPRFDVKTVLKTIEKRRPTLFPGVPRMYAAIAGAAAKQDLSSLRVCLAGAAPLPVPVARRLEELTGGKVRESYGLVEAAPLTHANPVYGRAKRGSAGLPITDTVCTLVDIDEPAKPAPPGGPGELAVSGPQVMVGYWKRPEETAEALRDGWLLTGDLATVDADGYCTIVDRKADRIVAGGDIVYPREIEQVLSSHPKVARAAVVGVPGRRGRETVTAYLVLAGGETATVEEMEGFLHERLAAHKVPERYEFRDDLPETMFGKVLRRALVEPAGGR